MTSSSVVGQFDLDSDRSPLDNGERLWVRCAGAALIGLAVGLAYLVVAPAVPGLVQAAWCLGPKMTACDPGSRETGQLIDLVLWALVLVTTSTAVTVLVGSAVASVGRVRLTVPLVLLGAPTTWSIAVLGQLVGIPLTALRSPVVLVQTVVAYLLIGVLGAPRVRPHWRWLITVAFLVGTAIVVASGYPFD